MISVRLALRSLRHSAVFSSTIVVSLALGLGANAALFSLVHSLLIEPLPVRRPGDLVHVRRIVETSDRPLKAIDIAATEIEVLARHSTVLSDATGFTNLDRPAVTVNGELEPPLSVQRVLPGFFEMLGVPIGATPRDRGAVISYRYWKTRFDGREILSGSLSIDGQPYPIVAIAPARFRGLELETSPSLWIWSNAPTDSLFQMVARLRPHVSPEVAETALAAMFREPDSANTGGTRTGARVEPCGMGISIVRVDYARPLIALLVLAALVLLATCANVAVLVTVRNARRAREFAVQASMGAGRPRLLVQLLIEGVVLSACGAVLSLPVARLVGTTILSKLPRSQSAQEFQIDLALLTFIAVASIVCMVLFSVAPACRATASDQLSRGLLASVTATPSRGKHRLQRTLIAAQACLSMVVLIGTGLFLRTLVNLTQAKPGFDSDHLLQLLLDPEGSGYGADQIGSLYRRLTERLEAIPGVDAVSGVRTPILRGRLSGWSEVEQVEVGPAFFETMRIPLVKGRYLAGLDHTLAGFDAVAIGGGQTILLPNRVVILGGHPNPANEGHRKTGQ